MPTLRVNGVNLYYECHGPEDGEPLVLNNGVFMNTASWACQLPALARRYRVLTYDMRGQGQSEHPEGPYSLEQHGEDLDALLTALAFGPAHMVGTSYGGELNLVMGIRYPHHCKSLCIIASVSHSDPLLAAMIERWGIAARLGDGPAFFRLIYADTYSEGFLQQRPELIPMAEERYASLDLRAADLLIDSFSRFNVTADLGKIALPTCIVSAELDILKPRKYGELMHQAIPGSEFHVVPGAGHVVVLERAAEVNTIILGFLAKQR
ncbi:alpha/beta fold hydrolase [Mesoterricola sediminis]|uniref:3-oxoadipate enol-lactone hydrolase n=1 Tax=Mesoterricola sediminis TaxID=2927980 RepID=A0AA48H030_9BACT|nr:alpha/beta fold hydrolase [Mesoterricola sediminis]BDU77535.1 3-oxoadipate enol-lactone hydrolase [Mesoterricola sediminis]